MVVLTHKGGQRSDGNVSDLFASGKGSRATAVHNVNIEAGLLIKIPVRNPVYVIIVVYIVEHLLLAITVCLRFS